MSTFRVAPGVRVELARQRNGGQSGRVGVVQEGPECITGKYTVRCDDGTSLQDVAFFLLEPGTEPRPTVDVEFVTMTGFLGRLPNFDTTCSIADLKIAMISVLFEASPEAYPHDLKIAIPDNRGIFDHSNYQDEDTLLDLGLCYTQTIRMKIIIRSH